MLHAMDAAEFTCQVLPSIRPQLRIAVLSAALDWLRSHPAAIDRFGRFFINLSRDTLVDPGTAAFVRNAVAEAGVDPRRVGFEVAEKLAIGNLTQANKLFGELRHLGI